MLLLALCLPSFQPGALNRPLSAIEMRPLTEWSELAQPTINSRQVSRPFPLDLQCDCSSLLWTAHFNLPS